MNFKELVAKARCEGVSQIDPPRSYGTVAEACGISRQHLYSLLRGKHCPRPWVQERIARGLSDLTGMSLSRVQKLLLAEWAL
jgi:DNA-binding phage protein